MDNLNKHWYVLYVNVRHEKKVFDKLQEQGIESYLPLVKNIKQWSDRKKAVVEPLFTGYVFVKLMPHEFDKPRYIPGVINYLSFEKKKAVVLECEIEALQYLVKNGYSLIEDTEQLHIGAKVKFLLSAFKNEIAYVDNINNEVATVYFESLNQHLIVKVPTGALKVVK